MNDTALSELQQLRSKARGAPAARNADVNGTKFQSIRYDVPLTNLYPAIKPSRLNVPPPAFDGRSPDTSSSSDESDEEEEEVTPPTLYSCTSTGQVHFILPTGLMEQQEEIDHAMPCFT